MGAAPAARVGAGAVRLRAHALPQPRARPLQRRADGSGRPRPQADLADRCRHRAPLRRARGPCGARALEDGAAADVAHPDRGSAAARPRPRDSRDADRPCGRHARHSRLLRHLELVLRGARPFLAGAPHLADGAPLHRVDPRDDRAALLAAPQALVRARDAAPSDPGGDDPGAGEPRLDRGRAADRAHRTGHRGAHRRGDRLVRPDHPHRAADHPRRHRHHPSHRACGHFRAVLARAGCGHLPRAAHGVRQARADAAGDQPPARHSAHLRLRRAGALLHLPHADRQGAFEPPPAQRRRTHGAGPDPRDAGRAARLPAPPALKPHRAPALPRAGRQRQHRRLHRQLPLGRRAADRDPLRGPARLHRALGAAAGVRRDVHPQRISPAHEPDRVPQRRDRRQVHRRCGDGALWRDDLGRHRRAAGADERRGDDRGDRDAERAAPRAARRDAADRRRHPRRAGDSWGASAPGARPRG